MRGAGSAVPARAHLVPARGCGSAPARGSGRGPASRTGPSGSRRAEPPRRHRELERDRAASRRLSRGLSLSARSSWETPSPDEPGLISGLGSGGAALPSAGTRGGPGIAGGKERGNPL